MSRNTKRFFMLVSGFFAILLHFTIATADPVDNRIIFLSDTQDPLWFERLYLAGNHNVEASDRILEQVISEKPDAVFHLGDLVAIGFRQNSWHRIDPFLLQLQQNRIPFYPTLGNHELFLFPQAGIKEFMKRFPGYRPDGYKVQIGQAVVIMLNSNFGQPDDGQITRQQSWYVQTLDSCEKDSTVKVIIVGCHHPPFTNSRIVSPDEDVRKYFLPQFVATPKARLFLSGHSHAFEHFHEYGKDFMVIGGGGGLQHPLKTGSDTVRTDRFQGNEKRRFHYLSIDLFENGMILKIHMLREDLSGFEVADRVRIHY